VSDFKQAEEVVKAGWAQLAGGVLVELQLAGLPTSLISDAAFSVGAEIEVDPGDDEAGGVFVTWRPDERLSGAAAESVRNGRFDDAVVQHSGSVALFMRNAIIEILKSAGFSVEPSMDDMRPLSAHVISAP
jgi:hypothetical protein